MVTRDGVAGLSEGSHSSGNGNMRGYPLGSLLSSCDNDGGLDDPLHYSPFSEEGSAFEDLPGNSHPSEGNVIEPNTFFKDGPANDKSSQNKNRHGGGIIIYIRDHLPCKEIKSYTLPQNIECKFMEVTCGKTKWLLVGG